MKKLLTACLLAVSLTGAAQVFDFRNDGALYGALDDQAGPVSFTNGGLVAIFTASDGSMNRTTSGFGLNSTIPGDDTDAMDVGEWIDMTFDAEVALTNVSTASWGASDQATIYVNGISNGVITSTGEHPFNISVPTGQVLRISSTAGSVGNGWSLDSIAVENNGTPSANQAPVLASIGNRSVTVSNLLQFSVSATDADNDLITLSASNLPPGAVFNTITNAGSISNTFNWGSAKPVGVYTTTFYAVDGTTNDFETITITVTNGPVIPVNNPPVLAAIGDKSLTVSNALNFTVSATDADNDLVMLSATNVPAGATFNSSSSIGSATGTFNWVSGAPTGTYSVTFFAHDGTTNASETITITVTNPPPEPPLTGAVWNVVYNLPYQSNSGNDYPGQFTIRNRLVERIDALENGDSATLSTFTFSANYGAGTIINALDSALNRGADISFIADSDAEISVSYGGTNSLLALSSRALNPLHLVVDDSSGGIMHDKLGLFDYGGSNQWVFIASWNFTLGASADQWNIALEARSPSLYSVYKAEVDELLAGHFHDDPLKSHTHDGSTFSLDGSWGTNFVRFAPYPDATEGGNNAETDITNLIAQAQSEIVFALNKLNRKPIRDALIAAANRGVTIQGVMPRSDTDPGEVSEDVYNALTNYVEFLPAYAEADYSVLDDGTYSDLIHAKYMVIDPQSTNAIVIHGSANWTTEALVNDNDNDENVVFLRHNEIAGEFLEHFQRITGSGVYDEGNSTLVSWDFEDDDQIADGGISVNSTQTVERIPAPSSYSYTDNALSCNGWNDGAGTAYWETHFSSINHSDIKVSSLQLASSTGPADFKLQYKTSLGGTYIDVPYGEVHVPDGGNGVLTRVLLPDACNNQTNVFLRWLLTSNTSSGGGTIGSTGAGRIDDIIISGTAYNQPPILDPIGIQLVFENEDLSFGVSASDPVDGDPVSIVASNLPSGSVFTSNTFTWSNAAPNGIYPVTFYASDKDGSVSETVSVIVEEKPKLLISEIADPDVDGGDAFRFVELYNAGDSAIELAEDEWYLSKQVNGGSWSDVALDGTVDSASTWVIANGADDFLATYGFAPDQESSSVSGNGDDAYFLFYGGDHENGILVDIYGEFDTDGTDTDWDYEDSRVVRNDNILEPNKTWVASEWTINSGASTNTMTPGEHGPTPTFQALEDLFIIPGDALSLQVTAVNTVRTDTIILSATNLPDGASFPTTTGTNTVSSLLSWNSPTAGVYSIEFLAEGLAGTRTRTISITVSSNAQIRGYFYGWDSDTIVKLNNGQFWKNVGGVGPNVDPPERNPDVIITKDRDDYVIEVENVLGDSEIILIDVTESIVTNLFTGLNRDNIYQLADGTTWEQQGSPTISSSVDPVTTWRWIDDGRFQQMRFLDRNGTVIGTCRVEPAADPTNQPIISKIDGTFRGWSNKRIFMLRNGQFWQQVDHSLSIETLSSPDVMLSYQSGSWYLSVDGAAPPSLVEVEQRTDITRTEIDGTFRGFGSDNIYPLTNGEWWRQRSLDNTVSIHSSPDVLLWNDDGADMLEIPDLGKSVEAEELNAVSVSTITNHFTGLRRGNTYRLATGDDWLQASSQNINAPASIPQAMLWEENGMTNLLVRSNNDEAIGACRVVDPNADGDGDLLSNAQEAIAGTDMDDSTSTFKLMNSEMHSEGTILRWNAVTGRVYSVSWTTNLTAPFQPLETNIVYPQNSWTDTVHSAEQQRYYRIEVQKAQ